MKELAFTADNEWTAPNGQEMLELVMVAIEPDYKITVVKGKVRVKTIVASETFRCALSPEMAIAMIKRLTDWLEPQFAEKESSQK